MYTQKSFLQRIFDQIVFTQIEVLGIVLLSGGIIFYAILGEIRKTSQDVAQISSYFENSVLKNVSDVISEVASRVATANVATMALWALVGAVVYALFLAALSVLRGAKDTVWSSFRFTHPDGHSSSQFFIFSVLERLAQVILVFSFIVYSVSLVNAVFPLVFAQVTERVGEYSWQTAWVGLYVIEFVIAIHVWVFLWRLVQGKHWRGDGNF